MELITKLMTVFGLGFVKLWAGIPAGMALGLHPAAAGIMAAVGTLTSVLIAMMLSGGVRKWLLHGTVERSWIHGNIYRLWTRYGVVGLGLISPLVGAPTGTVLGISLGAPRGRLLLWMGIGIALWSAGLSIAAAIGIDGSGILDELRTVIQV